MCWEEFFKYFGHNLLKNFRPVPVLVIRNGWAFALIILLENYINNQYNVLGTLFLNEQLTHQIFKQRIIAWAMIVSK